MAWKPPNDPPKDEMKQLFAYLRTKDGAPVFLDPEAAEMLREARGAYATLGLARRRILTEGSGDRVLLTWRGGEANETLALALLRELGAEEMTVEPRDGILTLLGLGGDAAALETALRKLASAPPPDPVELAGLAANLEREKMHPYLSRDLLAEDLAASRLRAGLVPEMARDLLA